MHMVVARKWMIGLIMVKALELLILTFLVMPAARAADADAAEAVDLSAVRAAIDAESDPELRAVMKEELEVLESRGMESLLTDHDRAGGAPELLGPPIEGTGGGGNYLPPAARAELEQIFSQGTGDPSKDGHLREQAEKVFEKYGIDHDRSGGMMGYDREGGEDGGRVGYDEGRQGEMTSPREAFQQWEHSEQGQHTDSATREQYREMSEQYQAEFEQRGEFERGGGLEQRGEGFERAMMEHMAPEAREQMERFMNERDMQGHEMSREGMEREYGGSSSEREAMERGGMEREMMEREFGGASSERSYEAPTHDYEAPTVERSYEAPTRDYEAPTREYEATTREYEAPTREYEAPTHEYEAPTYEAPTREYEAPQYEAPQHEYQYPEGEMAH